MTPQRWFLAASFGLSIVASTVALSPSPALAQSEEDPAPVVENSRYQFQGVINSSSVLVRTGPSESSYPTMKLEKGTTVTVVGIKFDWLKVLPPEGSFCYVSKVFVERRGDGSVGRVMKPDLSVRAGSNITNTKTQVQTKLNVGEDVEIIRDEGEYFIIKPPPGAYVFINKKDVDPVRPLSGDGARQASDGSTTQPTPDGTTADTRGPNLDNPIDSASNKVPSDDALAPKPLTAAQTQFDKLEAELRASAGKPLDQQTLADLQKRYEALVATNELSPGLQKIAQQRAALVKKQLDSAAELAQITKDQELIAQKQKALLAEQTEIQQRMDSRTVQAYTAVGTLWPSSLQAGTGGTLYRLTDPGTGRTIVYLRSDDASLSRLSGQFIGVIGKVADDAQLGLKVIPVVTFKVVDQSKVNSTVMAQIVPPSLLTKVPTASTTDAEPH